MVCRLTDSPSYLLFRKNILKLWQVPKKYAKGCNYHGPYDVATAHFSICIYICVCVCVCLCKVKCTCVEEKLKQQCIIKLCEGLKKSESVLAKKMPRAQRVQVKDIRKETEAYTSRRCEYKVSQIWLKMGGAWKWERVHRYTVEATCAQTCHIAVHELFHFIGQVVAAIASVFQHSAVPFQSAIGG